MGRTRRFTARARLTRLLYTSVGIAAVVYTGILLGGQTGIKQQTPQLAAWYGYGLIIVGIVLPFALGVLAWVLPHAIIRRMAITTSLLFLVAMMLFPVGLQAATLEGNVNPWYQGIHALHGVILAGATQRRWVWVYGAAQGAIIGVVQAMVREDAVKSANLTALNSFVYVVILMAVAIGVLSAADRLDAASAAARAHAATSAARRTKEREEARIDAVVHDDVMSVLLTASRESPPESLAEQARAALSSIELLERGSTAREYTAAETVLVLREPIERIAPDATVTAGTSGEVSVPADVVTALHDALAEALRNSVRHAGSPGQDVRRTVFVDVGAGGAKVVIRDDGKGFHIRAVSSRRLGVRLSIVERMSLVPGGSAVISSKPGDGTTVTLTWKEALA